MRLFYLEKACAIQPFVRSGTTICREFVIVLPNNHSCEDLFSLLPASPRYLVPALQNLLLNWNYNLTSQPQVIEKRLLTKLCNCHSRPLCWGWYETDRVHSGAGISARQPWSRWVGGIGLRGVWRCEAGQFPSRPEQSTYCYFSFQFEVSWNHMSSNTPMLHDESL